MGASESKLAFKQNIFLLAGQDEISPVDLLWAQVSSFGVVLTSLYVLVSHRILTRA